MKKFQVTKTISYDLTAIVENDNLNNEYMTADQVRELIDQVGDEWLDYEQSDGNDAVIEVREI